MNLRSIYAGSLFGADSGGRWRTLPVLPGGRDCFFIFVCLGASSVSEGTARKAPQLSLRACTRSGNVYSGRIMESHKWKRIYGWSTQKTARCATAGESRARREGRRSDGLKHFGWAIDVMNYTGRGRAGVQTCTDLETVCTDTLFESDLSRPTIRRSCLIFEIRMIAFDDRRFSVLILGLAGS